MTPDGRAGVLLISALTLLVGSASVITQSGPWRQADPARPIGLPADHVSHPEYRIEWWYYTGNLDASDGRRFGFHVTFFRVGVDPHPANPSRWTVRDLFIAHLALTDVAGSRHRFAERLNRAAPGWAGASTSEYHVWNEDWSVALDPTGAHLVKAVDREIGVNLKLRQTRPAALNGRSGYSQKGAQAGNASHYYSLTRMETAGSILVDHQWISVNGLGWMDHEFGSSVLESEQLGWDWLGLQLDDGRDLMIYQLRGRDGSVDSRSSGTLVEPDGRARPLWLDSATAPPDAVRGFRLDPRPERMWQSRASGARYPTAWRVQIPGADIDLSVRAAVEDQELTTDRSTGVTYWEGAVDVEGRARGHAAKGRGYLEMTGYSGAAMGILLR